MHFAAVSEVLPWLSLDTWFTDLHLKVPHFLHSDLEPVSLKIHLKKRRNSLHTRHGVRDCCQLLDDGALVGRREG